MKNEEIIKKLNEDDILRILVTHFQDDINGESWGYGKLIGVPGKDLRFIGIFRTDVDNAPFEYDAEKIDSETNFTEE